MKLWLSLGLLATSVSRASSAACDYYVSSSRGSDSAGGTTVDTAFKTINHAIYAPPPTTSSRRTICLRSDTYYLDNTLWVTNDLCSAEKALTIRAYPEDLSAGLPRPVISGGVIVGPFKPPSSSSTDEILDSNNNNEPWTAAAPASVVSVPSVLFENDSDGGWFQRARMPNRSPSDAATRYTSLSSTFQYTAPLEPPANSSSWPAIDKTGFRINATDFPEGFELSATDGAQVLNFHSWTAFWSNISSLNLTSQELLFTTCVCVFVCVRVCGLLFVCVQYM